MKEKIKHWIIFKIERIMEGQLEGAPYLVCEKDVLWLQPISNYTTDMCVSFDCGACGNTKQYGRFKRMEKKFIKLGQLLREVMMPHDLEMAASIERRNSK